VFRFRSRIVGSLDFVLEQRSSPWERLCSSTSYRNASCSGYVHFMGWGFEILVWGGSKMDVKFTNVFIGAI